MFVLGEGQEFVPRLDFQGTNGGKTQENICKCTEKAVNKRKKGREKYPNPNLIIANNLQYVIYVIY